MLSRETFKEALELMEKKNKHEDALIAALELCSPQEYVNAFIYSEYYDMTLKLLTEGMELGDDDILYYWTIDLEFGTKYEPGCIRYGDDTNIDISTVDKLYDYCISKKEAR